MTYGTITSPHTSTIKSLTLHYTRHVNLSSPACYMPYYSSWLYIAWHSYELLTLEANSIPSLCLMTCIVLTSQIYHSGITYHKPHGFYFGLQTFLPPITLPYSPRIYAFTSSSTGSYKSGLMPMYLHASYRTGTTSLWIPTQWWIYGPQTSLSSRRFKLSTSTQT